MDFTPIVNKLSVYKLNCRHLKNAIDQKKKKKKATVLKCIFWASREYVIR